MIYLYKDLTNKEYSDYQIKKLVKEEKLYMIQKGVYSDKLNYNYIELIFKKHPNSVFNLETACFCYGLLKKEIIPYKIATKQKDRKIKDLNIKQIFMTDNLYHLGISKITYKGFNINIYDLERLLIEIVRNKPYIDFENYKEIISNYKKISKLLNKQKISEYFTYFKDNRIQFRIKNEIFK
ncbi:MAG: hypothetical protein ACK5HP_04275 [Bacilli bacterium]